MGLVHVYVHDDVHGTVQGYVRAVCLRAAHQRIGTFRRVTLQRLYCRVGSEGSNGPQVRDKHSLSWELCVKSVVRCVESQHN